MDIPRQSNARKRRGRYALLGVVGLLAILLVTVGLSRLKPAAPSIERASVLIDSVKRGSMLRQVRGVGKFVPEQVRLVPAPAEGRVERILVQPGMEVSTGTLLVELVNPQLQQEAVDTAFQVKAAEADLMNLRVRLQSDRMTQQAGAATIQSDYNQARLQLDADEALARDGLIPALSVKLSRVRVQELANRLKIEQQRLTINTEAVKAQLTSQQTRVEQLRALARLKSEQVTALGVRAGISGVVQEVAVQMGQQVTPGTNLARVADVQSLKAELKVPETQAKDIFVGMLASVDTRNGIVAGRVARIDPAAQQGTVTVDIALEGGLPQGARPDLSVDGTIELERLNDILYVGRLAFGQENSSQSIFKLDAGGTSATRVQVKFGRSSVNSIEVLEGLREGDEVILSDMSAMDKFDYIRLN